VVYKSCIPYFYPHFSKIKVFTRLGGKSVHTYPLGIAREPFATPFGSSTPPRTTPVGAGDPGSCGDGYVMRGRNYSVFKDQVLLPVTVHGMARYARPRLKSGVYTAAISRVAALDAGIKQ
jgi:hypothetical protein